MGRDLCEGNEELSARTEQQAVNVAQTTGRVRDLASTVAQNAQAVASVNDQAVTVRDVAETGARAMEKSIRSVEAIQVTAHRMNEINGVIDMLAFQTNILSAQRRRGGGAGGRARARLCRGGHRGADAGAAFGHVGQGDPLADPVVVLPRSRPAWP